MHYRLRAATFVPVLAATCFFSAGARAEAPDPRQAALAQTLYDAAVSAMRAGDFATACPKLEQVVDLAPTGVGAKLMLAECYEGAGRRASAWTMYYAVEAAAAAAAGQAERQKKAHDRAKALRPTLATLTVVVPPAVASIPGLEIRRDGLPVKSLEFGVPLPADRGRHTLVAVAPGRHRWEKTVDLPADGAAASVEIGALPEDGSSPPPPDVSTPGGPPAPPPPGPWIARRKAGLALAAVGLAGIGVGSYFGVVAIVKKNQSNDGPCHPDNHCDPTGLQLRDDGLHAAAASTALFVAGAAVLATGVTLMALPTGPTAEAKVVVGAGRVDLRGTW